MPSRPNSEDDTPTLTLAIAHAKLDWLVPRKTVVWFANISSPKLLCMCDLRMEEHNHKVSDFSVGTIASVLSFVYKIIDGKGDEAFTCSFGWRPSLIWECSPSR